jgi:hypothetical protein
MQIQRKPSVDSMSNQVSTRQCLPCRFQVDNLCQSLKCAARIARVKRYLNDERVKIARNVLYRESIGRDQSNPSQWNQDDA